MSVYDVSPDWGDAVLKAQYGSLPTGNINEIDDSLEAWSNLSNLLEQSTQAGATFTNPIVSTYTLVYTGGETYTGGVLSHNGEVHFIPRSANVGQKLSTSGAVSTYSLVYTTTTA